MEFEEILEEMSSILNSHYAENWAITGSVAILCHAHAVGAHTGIWPKDLDIIINSVCFNATCFQLVKILGLKKITSCPGPLSVVCQLKSNNKQTRFDLDVFKSGSGKGEVTEIVRMLIGRRRIPVNVITLNVLYEKLQLRLEDACGDEVVQTEKHISVIQRVRMQIQNMH